MLPGCTPGFFTWSKRHAPVKKTAAGLLEVAEGKERQKIPADESEHASENTIPEREFKHASEKNKSERDVEKDTTLVHQAATSEAKRSKTMPASSVAREDFKEKMRFSGNVSDLEQFIDSDEDIYRDEEEIEKEALKHALIGENRLGLAPEMDVVEYCHKEWRGKTARAKLMKKGYEAVSKHFNFIRRVRGDNYCALRAFLFQALSQTTKTPTWLADPDFTQLPAKLMSTYDWIKHWKLLQRFDEGQTNPHENTMKEYLKLLKEKWEKLSGMKIPADKQAACDEIFQNEDVAYSLYEAVKFLMLSKAIHLYNENVEGKEVPVFSWLLFARNTSSNPQEFMQNHLNQVGDTGGLEQVEMFLLGHAVQHTIRVYRLYKYETDEFITDYPNDQEEWPVVSLITEDDRHYNVLVGIIDTPVEFEIKSYC